MAETTLAPPKGPSRVLSLDQMRGYAIFGMILVNYLGKFTSMPDLLRHQHGKLSYADAVAPLFMFVVGMGFRLSFPRHVDKNGLWWARWAAVKRYVTLVLIGILFYGPLSYWCNWWDALVDIGFAGLLALPFIRCKGAVRIGAAVFYLALFQFLSCSAWAWGFLSQAGGFVNASVGQGDFGQAVEGFTTYSEWTLSRSIDGGPLGPLSWVFSLLLGTIAYDTIASEDRSGWIVVRALAWATGLMVLSWALMIEWPGVKESWPYSQTTMTAPYPLFYTGVCFLVFLAFHVLSDVGKLQIPTFSTLGMNALTIYLVHIALLDIHGRVISREAEAWPALGAFVCLYLVCYAVARRLRNDNIIIRL
jgi:predicted acyltransferase